MIKPTNEDSPREVLPRNVPLPKAICAAVAELLEGSHQTREDLFFRAGAIGPPPNLPHETKWKTWLYELGQNPDVDGLVLVGRLIEEFMDLPPLPIAEELEFLGPISDPVAQYQARRDRLIRLFAQHGLQYFPGGRLIPTGSAITIAASNQVPATFETPRKPESVEELLRQIVRGLPRAMHPLFHRRRHTTSLSFDNEYDIQDLVHALLRPWISDIRPEEFTPSYAGSTTRMDFLLPDYKLVLELKRIRDAHHAKRVGQELIIDIEHYRQHPRCMRLWCVIYDPSHTIENPSGLVSDLKGMRTGPDGRSVDVEIFVFGFSQ